MTSNQRSDRPTTQTDPPPTARPLAGRVAVVAGATRGAGRGVAIALGEAGATVWCTGRSTAGRRSEYDRPETVEETAELVTAAGGTGVVAVTDHTDDGDVRDLFARVEAEHGGLDILVTSLGGEHRHGEWDRPVWEQDVSTGRQILRGTLEAHLLTATHGLGLLHRWPGGLHVGLTDGDAAYNDGHYRINAYVDLVKTGITRLARSFGEELAPRGGAALAVSPGWLRSEMMLDGFGVTEETWQQAWVGPEAKGPPSFAVSESPRYVGRCIAAVAADPDRSRWNQRSTTSEELGPVYGVTDVDGSRPRAWSYIVALEAGEEPDVADYR